ncbi:MAG: Kelch repeat-containing protein [bacterium]
MKTKTWCAIFLALAALLLGCAGRRTTPGSVQTETPIPPAGGNGMAGNTLSAWRDRTPLIEPSPVWPAAAEDCALIYDPRAHRLVLCGGKNDDNENLDQVWEFDLQRNRWQQIEIVGEKPPPTEDHVAVYDPMSHRLILHGGENGATWNNTWALSLTTHRWRNMTDAAAPAREDHTAVYDSRAKRMVIFGGRNWEIENSYDLWALDLDPQSPTFEKWRDLTVKEDHPAGRFDHVAVFDSLKNRMLVYGGWSKKEKEYLGDTWAFYFATMPEGALRPEAKGEWKKIKAKKSHPPKRRHAVGAYDSSRNWFILCGGFGEEGYLNDVWAFDLALDNWTNITPGPQPRIDHQAVYDPRSQHLIIYGGDARLQNKFHDMWELQIQAGRSFNLSVYKTLDARAEK